MCQIKNFDRIKVVMSNDFYKNLRKNAMQNKISPKKFLDGLFKLDQKSADREAAEKNIKILRKPEVAKFLKSDKKILPYYAKFLSLTEFHLGQRRADKNKHKLAYKHFWNSYQAIKKYPGEWASYVKATLFYLQRKQISEKLIKECNPGNRPILKNFNSGLKERGGPSYMKDFLKSRK